MKSRKPSTTKAKKPRGRGRPEFRPTKADRERVKLLTSFGIPQKYIATKVMNPGTGEPIALNTLRAHFAEELEHGTSEANAEVAGVMFNAIRRDVHDPGIVQQRLFWLRTRGGDPWRLPKAGEDGAVDPQEAGSVSREQAVDVLTGMFLRLAKRAKKEGE